LIGQRVKKLRLAKGWSQPELARRSGLTEKTVSNYETGARGAEDPPLATVQAFADALEVPITDLLGEPEGAATFP
jgi:transcriptional regulator with XRE-family HTH domain